MNMQRWIKKHSTSVSDKSGFVIGPFIRVVDLQHLMKTHDVVPKISPVMHPLPRPERGETVTTPYAKAYTRRCPQCRALYRTDEAGARWTTRSGNPRYLHPACPAGAKPVKGWTPA